MEVADSGTFDHEVKAPLYARFGLRELWIVDLARREVVVHRRPSASVYAEVHTLGSPGPTALQALAGVTVDLSGLFD